MTMAIYHQIGDDDLGFGFSLNYTDTSRGLTTTITGVTAANIKVYYVSDEGDPASLTTAAAISSPVLTEPDSTNMPGFYHLKIPNSNLPTDESWWGLNIVDSTGSSAFNPIFVNVFFKETHWSQLGEDIPHLLTVVRNLAKRQGVSA